MKYDPSAFAPAEGSIRTRKEEIAKQMAKLLGPQPENPAIKMIADSRRRFEEHGAKEAAKEAKYRPAPLPRFTTAYAIDWGKEQGWKLMDRERYDFRSKRHHDLPFGADAQFDSPAGIVYVQGAGTGQRAAHRRKFDEWGGVERATRLHVRFVYLEFASREDLDPKVDWWV